MKAKIYVASSWRNGYYETMLQHLRSAGHEVWNWREPPTGGNGFRWQDASPTLMRDYSHGEKIGPDVWRKVLKSPVAQAGFASDLCGMNWCDVGIMLHPCGKSAHLEAGWMAGRGKAVHVFCPEDVEPDLMVLALNGRIFSDVTLLIRALDK